MEVEAQLRANERAPGAKDGRRRSEEVVPDLMDGKVISVKEERSLVVGNFGRSRA